MCDKSLKPFEKVVKNFNLLKEESLINGKNVATLNNIVKKANVSRTNFYKEDIGENWKSLKNEIDYFKEHFEELAKGKYKNPEVEKLKEKLNKKEKEYLNLAEQNLELFEKINRLENIIKDKESEVLLLNKRLSMNNKY